MDVLSQQRLEACNSFHEIVVVLALTLTAARGTDKETGGLESSTDTRVTRCPASSTSDLAVAAILAAQRLSADCMWRHGKRHRDPGETNSISDT